MSLTWQRCWNHADREAAARCPTCTRFYCRECVTEYTGRMVCATCLRTELAAERDHAKPIGGLARERLRIAAAAAWQVTKVGAGLALTWFFFDLVAHKLISLPEKFHEGTFWKQTLLHENDDE